MGESRPPLSCTTETPDSGYDELTREEQGEILRLQQSILEAVALGHDHGQVINEVCRLEEQLLPNAVASVMLLDADGSLNVFAAPNIPATGVSRLNGLRPGPGAGSCGNVVYRGKPVFVADTLTDPKWADLRPLAIDFNLKACWSMPIRSAGGAIIGTFALSSFEHRAPTPFHRKMLEIGASIIGIVLERRRQLGALEASETRYRQMFEVNQAVKLLIDPADGRIVDANSAALAFYGYPRERLLRMAVGDINVLPQAAIQARLEDALAQRRMRGEFRHRLASGELRDVEVHSAPIADGERTLLYSIIHDITERKQAEGALRRERDFISAVFESVANVVLVIDRHGRIVRFNQAAEQATGYRFEEVRDRPFFWERFLVPEQTKEVRAVFDEILRGRVAPRHENHWVGRDGSRRLFEWSNTLVTDPVGTAEYLVTIGADITARKEIEAALHLAANVFDNTHEGILVTDAAGTIVDTNPAFTRLTGYRRDEVVGRNPSLLQSGRHDRDFYRELWHALDRYGHWSGEVYPEWLNISAVRNDRGEATRYVAVFMDISALKAQEKALERLAHYDALTGLPNRVLLADRMRQGIAQTRRAGRLMGVAYLDLDGFKPVNDTYGHEAGDRLLVEVARRMAATVRAGDTVSRLGGDEFVVLLPNVASLDECEIVLERILEVVGEPIALEGHDDTVTVSASIGVSLYFADDTDPDTLLRRADHAMYQAKEAGRGRYDFYDAVSDRLAQRQGADEATQEG